MTGRSVSVDNNIRIKIRQLLVSKLGWINRKVKAIREKKRAKVQREAISLNKLLIQKKGVEIKIEKMVRMKRRN